MGTNRKQHTEQSAAEVSKKLSAEFHADYHDIYKVWAEYNNVIKECSKSDSIYMLKQNNETSRNVFNYLICFALETINMEMVKEITDGKKTVN
jgi:hypothetical protein